MSAPNRKEVEWAISELEQEESSKAGYILLSALYNIRDKLSVDVPAPIAYSMQAPLQEYVGQYGDSEFLKAVSGKDSADAWAVMDELMDTLQVVNARAYNSVLRKIQEL